MAFTEVDHATPVVMNKKDVEKHRNNMWIGQIVRVPRPHIGSSNNVIFSLTEAVVLEIHKNLVLVTDVNPKGMGKHKRKWCVSIIELMMENPMYGRDRARDNMNCLWGD